MIMDEQLAPLGYGHSCAASRFNGESTFGVAKSDWMLMRTAVTDSAADHFSRKMSRQMLPVRRSTLG